MVKKEPKPDEDPASRNPTGNQRRSSAGQRRKVDRRTYGGTPWQKPEDKKK
jgi:hypothetical protein